MNKQIKICISTHKKYSFKTVPVLINSLFESRFPLTDVIIVEGGHETEFIEKRHDESTLIKVAHNSFDFTSLVAIVENNIQSDFFLLLHDTCRVGINFCLKLFGADLNYEKIALTGFPSMSIGLYRHSYLLLHKSLILSQKNTDYSEHGTALAKLNATKAEDLLLWKLNDVACGCLGYERVQQPVDNEWYETSTNRIQEYFPQLDLYKLKANYGQICEGMKLITTI